jgi:multidrug resistance efflux pump
MTDSSDLVERLEDAAVLSETEAFNLLHEAADTIQRLEATITGLRAEVKAYDADLTKAIATIQRLEAELQVQKNAAGSKGLK